MPVGLEALAALVVAYLWRKAKRVAGRADAEVDRALDAGMDRLHEAVGARLGAGALAPLRAQAVEGVDQPRAQALEGAIVDAARVDGEFAARLRQVVEALRAADPAGTGG